MLARFADGLMGLEDRVRHYGLSAARPGGGLSVFAVLAIPVNSRFGKIIPGYGKTIPG
jgi:hypothetical protein